MSTHVYCDESGYNGSHLLDPDQPNFVYAAVCISPDEAAELVARVRSECKLPSDVRELKAHKLAKNVRGQRAIDIILAELANRRAIAIYDKRFALGGKFFEFVFEPVIAEKSSLFYATGFHRFIAGLVYYFLVARDPVTDRLMNQFQSFIREGDEDAARALFAIRADAPDGPIPGLLDFMAAHEGRLREELDGFRRRGDPGDARHIEPYVLDLTSSALFGLLTTLTRRHGKLTVVCDESMPLRASDMVFRHFIDRTDRRYVHVDGEHRPLGIDLAVPIAFASSTESAGVQLADVTAGAVAYAMANRDFHASERWLEACDASLDRTSVLPDVSELDLTNPRTVAHSIVLQELVDRSRDGEDVLEDMEHFIPYVHMVTRLDPFLPR